jgi:chemotaxis regulatin CheY-phosphate phosphatase CheZ
MTQEELDALMAGDEVDLDEEVAVLDEENSNTEEIDEALDKDVKDAMPPIPTEDNKVVTQLDSVTKDSEEKATEIFDRLEGISEYISKVEDEANDLTSLLKENIELFEKLSNHFDDVSIFKTFLEKNSNALNEVEDIVEKSQMSSDEIMMIMDTMQYQDIHRQKIERVINVMRGLLRYMNTLFGSDIKDEDRVSSAQHIIGDSDTDDVVTNEEIEALLESLGKK